MSESEISEQIIGSNNSHPHFNWAPNILDSSVKCAEGQSLIATAFDSALITGEFLLDTKFDAERKILQSAEELLPKSAQLLPEVAELNPLGGPFVQNLTEVPPEVEGHSKIGIRTPDIWRTLIPIDGYGNDQRKADIMENIIASARDGIQSRELKSGGHVERFIAKRYLTDVVLLSSPRLRSYQVAMLLKKHQTYAPAFSKFLGEQESKTYTLSTSINGLDYPLLQARLTGAEGGSSWVMFHLPNERKTFTAAILRKNQLFSELMETVSTFRTPAALNRALEIVSEKERNDAGLWKYRRGSAGISRLESLAWLEAADIHVGELKAGIDPNLEALMSSLDGYRRAYPEFYQSPPSYYAEPSHSSAQIFRLKRSA